MLVPGPRGQRRPPDVLARVPPLTPLPAGPPDSLLRSPRPFGNTGANPGLSRNCDQGVTLRDATAVPAGRRRERSEEHTSELQSLMRTSYAVLCLKQHQYKHHTTNINEVTTTLI